MQKTINKKYIFNGNILEETKFREGCEYTKETATAKDLREFIESAEYNGGYYIARYESTYALDTGTIETSKAASKISSYFNYGPNGNGKLWNNITQINASKVCINTYFDADSVESDLINSYAWDTARLFIQESGNTGYGNERINSEIENTGTRNDEVCKINDMGGNLQEYLTETTNNKNGILMGTHGYNLNFLNEFNIDKKDEKTGFRMLLYLRVSYKK